MGQSVLTPKEVLLGKAVEPVVGQTTIGVTHSAAGEREFGQHSETGMWGTGIGACSISLKISLFIGGYRRGFKAVDDGRSPG